MKALFYILLLVSTAANAIVAENYGNGDGIRAALAAAADNDIVEFLPGEHYVVTGPAYLDVANKQGLTIQGNGATLVFSTNTRGFYVKNSSAIRISGLTFIGSIGTLGYTGNEEQGRIVVEASTNIDITNNRWESTAGAVFIQVNTTHLRFHHNVINGSHAGIQTSSAYYGDIDISDNTFIGHVSSPNQGSDDQIALFGNAGGRVVIANNRIDKRGPASQNHARAINVSVGAGPSTDIRVTGNTVSGVATLTPAQARPAIIVEGASPSRTVSRVLIADNTVLNSNVPIRVGAYVDQATVRGNTVDTAIPLAGYGDAGKCIVISPGGTSNGLVVATNHITNCTDGIAISSTQYARVTGNTMARVSVGIRADALSDSTLTDNTVTSSTSIGLLINNSARTLVTQNTVAPGPAWGIQFQGAAASGTATHNTATVRSIAGSSTVTILDNL